MRIGLTGGIGSGKSALAAMLQQAGAAVIDADAIAHELTAPGGEAIGSLRAAFGEGVIDARGALDRARMRELAFADPAQRARLEAILHPLIGERLRRLAEELPGPYVVLVVPLLIESLHRWRERVDRIVVVDCPVELQEQRVMQRSGLSREQVRDIMRVQSSREQRLAAADEVVDNSGDLEHLRRQALRLHRHALEAARGI
ncbi:MAG: dephospho-CoA kinase [Betaproteobacteria bacterium]|nr:dephospho-CoA kinase [Betaproteobacteria bacterium]